MESFPRTLLFYETADGKVPASEWLDSVEDLPVYGEIMTRLERVKKGNFGDHRSVGGGVSELKIDFGPGYRIYYGLDGKELVILLVCGTKKTQRKDIRIAKEYWDDFNA